MDIKELLADPVIQSALLPLAASFAAAGLIRLIGGPGLGGRLASLGLGLGLAAGYLSIHGLPAFPPVGSGQKVFYIVLAGAVLGVALDMAGNPRRLVMLALFSGPVAGLWWLAAPRLIVSTDGSEVLRLGVLAAAAIVVTYRLYRRSNDGLTPSVMLLTASLGIGAVALIGASASISQTAFALAAAAGGFMLWNWPGVRFVFGSAALFCGAGMLVALVGQMAFFTRAPVESLSFLLLIFYSDAIAKRIPLGKGAVSDALRPVVLGLICMVPVAVSVVLAYLSSAGGDVYLG